MPARRSTTRLALVASAVVAALIVGACGGAASTPAATPVPTIAPATEAPVTAAPTEAPVTEAPATETPTEAPAATPAASAEALASGTLANSYEDIRAYYESQGFQCLDQTASTQATGWLAARCISDADANGLTTVIGLVVDPDGVLGDAFAGVVAPAGSEMPQVMDMITPLAFLVGATLGETVGAEAGAWLATNLGSEMAQTQINGNTIATYTENDNNGVGAYVEIATPAFLDAPTP